MLVFHKILLSSSFWNVNDLDIFWNINLDQNVGIHNTNADYKESELNTDKLVPISVRMYIL